MAIAMDGVLKEAVRALHGTLKESLQPQAVLESVLWSVVMYMTLWAIPEPISKGIAAAMTVAMISYLGVHTLWSLMGGWKQLIEVVDGATTFGAIHAAGMEFSKVMGQNVARILVMVVTAIVGGATSKLIAKFRKMPGFSKASQAAEAQGSIPPSAAGEVQAVSASSRGTFRITRSSGTKTAKGGTPGGFYVTDWTDYPPGLPRPKGPFRILKGKEYEDARAAADKINKQLRSADPAKYAGKQIHEIHPVKFGGSPTDLANKVMLPPAEHAKLTTFWNRLMRVLE